MYSARLFKHFLARSVIVAIALFNFGSAFAQATDDVRLKQATELIDTYYGNKENLEIAGFLIEQVLQQEPKSANAYLQAARLIGRDTWFLGEEISEPLFTKYGILVDEAIARDPTLPEAFILKAQYFSFKKNYSEQLRCLEKAKLLGTDSRWLWIGYSSYYLNMGMVVQMMEAYAKVEAMGPGNKAGELRAYILALENIGVSFRSEQDAPIRLKKYAELARKERHPADAWSPDFFAQHFTHLGMFDEAIALARESQSTMDFRTGRLTLATALFAKAAQLQQVEHKPTKYLTPYLVEANSFGFSVVEVASRFQAATPLVKTLMPTIMFWVSPANPSLMNKT